MPNIFDEERLANEQSERELAQYEQVWRWIAPRLEQAEHIYNHALTSLWIGNGAAALAVLGFIGATRQSGSVDKGLIWPLGLFLAGLFSMGIGAVWTLVVEIRTIRRMRNARSWLELRIGDMKSRDDQFSDARTIWAVVSAICFLMGIAVGLAVLYFCDAI